MSVTAAPTTNAPCGSVTPPLTLPVPVGAPGLAVAAMGDWPCASAGVAASNASASALAAERDARDTIAGFEIQAGSDVAADEFRAGLLWRESGSAVSVRPLASLVTRTHSLPPDRRTSPSAWRFVIADKSWTLREHCSQNRVEPAPVIESQSAVQGEGMSMRSSRGSRRVIGASGRWRCIGLSAHRTELRVGSFRDRVEWTCTNLPLRLCESLASLRETWLHVKFSQRRKGAEESTASGLPLEIRPVDTPRRRDKTALRVLPNLRCENGTDRSPVQ